MCAQGGGGKGGRTGEGKPGQCPCFKSRKMFREAKENRECCLRWSSVGDPGSFV